MKITFVATIFIIISSIHQTHSTFTNILPTLWNCLVQLWNPQKPINQPISTYLQTQPLFVVTHNRQHQSTPQNQPLNNIINKLPPHIPKTHQISHFHPSNTPKTKQLALPIIPAGNNPTTPISLSQWSTLNQPQLLPIPMTQKDNPYPYQTTPVNKPLYPVVIQPSYWEYHLPASDPFKSIDGKPNQNVIAKIPATTVQQHTVQGDDGFAGLAGKIRAQLTLNYMPPFSAQPIPLSTLNPRANALALALESIETTLKPTNDPVVNSSVEDKVGKKVTTAAVTDNYSVEELVEGSGTVISDQKRSDR